MHILVIDMHKDAYGHVHGFRPEKTMMHFTGSSGCEGPSHQSLVGPVVPATDCGFSELMGASGTDNVDWTGMAAPAGEGPAGRVGSGGSACRCGSPERRTWAMWTRH